MWHVGGSGEGDGAFGRRSPFSRVPLPIWGLVLGAFAVASWLEGAGYHDEMQLVSEDDGMVEFTTSEGEVLKLEEWRRAPGPDPWLPIEAAAAVGLVVLGIGTAFAWVYAGNVARQ